MNIATAAIIPANSFCKVGPADASAYHDAPRHTPQPAADEANHQFRIQPGASQQVRGEVQRTDGGDHP